MCRSLSVYLPRLETAWQLKFSSIAKPISHLAAQHQVSRKFFDEQRHKADAALDEVFSDAKKEQEVLFALPVTQTW